jgi:DNA-binding XRE family transcriptional regulator
VDKNGITCDVSLCLPFVDSVVYSPQHPDSHTGDGLYEKKSGEAAGLTEEELARRLKTKKTAIPRIENHSEDTKLSTLGRTAIALGKRLQVSPKP